ncbi:MAG: SDR family NAD(P)-dependent oxidoreductase [Cytophagales bacterium]|nr:SDR family NAD(P)-dependent oxidoreductase [Cytophagales bacterium]
MEQKQIAIVGISLRFPGANTVVQFWRNLMSGKESVERYDEAQLKDFGIHPRGYESEQFVRASARLKDIDQFDHNFFNYSPKDAALLDPQQRLLLECGYEALEDAGLPVGTKSHEVGVFAGAYVSNYLIRNLGPMVSERSKAEDNVPYLYQCETDHLATNLAYRLNLTGPSISVQSWCTTAFSALYFASRAIQHGDCKTAMVGAANVIVPQEGYFAPEGGLWSITGKTRSFDKSGDGCVSGSGVAVVVLKELEEAIKDRNQIYALLKGVTVNNDGKSSAKLGYHGATVEGQYLAITKTLSQSGVGTEKITYLEANGLATPLADRMELKALSKVFENTNEQNQPWLGSIKPNIGHLLSASGMAALIKSCLICKNRKIPPLINHEKFTKVNQRMVDPNFNINHEAIDLSTRVDPIICGMNSFGIGGSNAYAIVEEAPVYTNDSVQKASPVQLITWSGKTEQALQQFEQDLNQLWEQNHELSASDLSFSLNTGKSQQASRQSAMIQSGNDRQIDKSPFSKARTDKTEAVWIFTGYGDTYDLKKFVNLYQYEPVFKEVLDHFFQYALEKHDQDFQTFFFDANVKDDLDTEFKSNILTIILNYAYGRLLLHWGIKPSKIVGISNGEYTAACLAGVFTFEEMIDVVIRQSDVIATLPPGKMVTVIAEKARIQPLIAQHELDHSGNYLSNAQVVAGSIEKCEAFCDSLKAEGIDYLPVEASFAFHSMEVDPILSEVEALYQDIDFKAPVIPLISTVTGQEVTDEIMQPAYWSCKMRAPVLFAEAISKVDPEKAVFVECGPGDKYSPVLKYLFDESAIDSYPVISSQSEDAYQSLLILLGNLWQHGIDIAWSQYHALKPGRKIALPHYPFERQSFWLDYSKEASDIRSSPEQIASSDKEAFENWFYSPSWKPLINPAKAPSNTLATTQTWLIFTNGEAYTESLITSLHQQGQTVISVSIGDSFEGKDNHLTVNPNGLEPVFKLLKEKGIAPDRVLYFWCFGNEKFHSSRTLAYSAIIDLVNAVNQLKSGKSWNLLIGTSQLFRVHRKDMVLHEKSLLLGPARTIPNEFSNVSCQLIDLDEGPPFDELVALTSAAHSPVLAQRHGTLFEEYLAPIPHSSDTSISSFDTSGTYILTGGMGGLGHAISTYLLEQYPGIALVLVGRTSVALITENEKYQQLQSLAAQKGGTLVYHSLHLADQAQVNTWASMINAEYQNIRGILHLAGIQGGGMISFNDRKGEEAAFEAKVDGTAYLIEAFMNYKLDFFMMSSSSTALFGFFGLTDYASANSSLDQLAQSLGNEQTKYVSINWDMWAIEGMGAGTGLGEAIEALRSKNKTFAIDTDQGIKALELVLQWDLPQVAVLTRKPEVIANDSNLKQENIHEVTSKEEGTEWTNDENLETAIVRVWERIFERSNLSTQDNFFQLGGHSLSGVMFINKMKSRFPSLELSLNEIFDYPTPEKIAALIRERAQSTSLANPLKVDLWELNTLKRTKVLTAHLTQEISQLLQRNISEQEDIPSAQLAEVSNHLYFHFKKELELPLYAYEVSKRPQIKQLAAYIAHEFELFHGLKPVVASNGHSVEVAAGPKTWKPTKANPIPGTVFICSAPRAGSTLLRLMLSGHSELFAPPELWLLGQQTMKAWANKVPGHVIQHGGVGGILKSLGGMKESDAQRQVQAYVDQNASCFEVYEHLRGLAGKKIFIDKTPNYYKDPHVFDRMEDGFSGAKYIHLIRHPYSTMDSILKNRIYTLYEAYRNQPIKAAEHIWNSHNQHIRHFMEHIDPTRSLDVHFEELVTQPKEVMQRICKFLGVKFEERMIHPYTTGNMIAGDGDPNILNHEDIDPTLAEVWKNIDFQPDLNAASTELANYYQYELIPSASINEEQPIRSNLVASLDEEDLDDLLNQLA